MTMESVRESLRGSRPGRVAYRGAVGGRLRIERWGLATRTAAGRAPAKRGRILAYHSIGTPEWGVNDVTPPATSSGICRSPWTAAGASPLLRK